MASLNPDGPRAETSLPGGESGNPESPFYVNLLDDWLRNDAFDLALRPDSVASADTFLPDGARMTEAAATDGIAGAGGELDVLIA